jgi:uncharacterized protein DUF4406
VTIRPSIYVAGRITGVPNYRDVFTAASNALAAKGWQVYDPASFEDVMGQREYEACLRVDLSILLTVCSAAFFTDGWELSRGARAERAVADVIGLDMYDRLVDVPMVTT